MNEHALAVLDLRRALSEIARYAATPAGREAVAGLRPCADLEWIRTELERVDEAASFLADRSGWGFPLLSGKVEAALERLRVEGGVLDPLELHGVGTLLAAADDLLALVDAPAAADSPAPDEAGFDALAPLFALLHRDPARLATIERTVDDQGDVLDTASAELRRIRRELSDARGTIVRRLEAYVAGLSERIRVADASVTIREGRYVIPIRREGKGEVGGIVHDESATGATLFVEPPVALQIMNRIRELEREEAREIHRVLSEESRALHRVHEALEGSYETVVALDSLFARGRAQLAWEGTPPELIDRAEEGGGAGTGSGAPPRSAPPPLVIEGGRHPLLLAGGVDVVPFDLTLAPDERTLVVSGPNTGGKTVLLKAIGLIVLLTQSGVVPPVRAGTRLPLFGEVFADIGDEQSIERSLSTFSAHLENLRELAEGAGADSLVLVDEVGTGTDPAEGVALAIALLERLRERGALTIATSHLGALKRLDAPGSGVVNASLRFDGERMVPTYELVKGRPGRSWGLATARRLGFPADLLDRAQEHLDEGEVRTEELLTRLERDEARLAKALEDAEAAREEAERMRARLREREEEVTRRERDLERAARTEARTYLLDAREEVEAAIERLERAVAEGVALDRAATEARRTVERAAEEQREARAAAAAGTDSDPSSASPGGGPLEPGAPVVVHQGGNGPGTSSSRAIPRRIEGRVVEVRGDRVVVDVGGVRLEVAAEAVASHRGSGTERGTSGGAGKGRSAGGGHPTPIDSGRESLIEADLRGLRVDEVELELGRALDRAILADLPSIRIIHGKGTGALRERVRELLTRDGRVEAFRAGDRTEGGTGVTVVSFR